MFQGKFTRSTSSYHNIVRKMELSVRTQINSEMKVQAKKSERVRDQIFRSSHGHQPRTSDVLESFRSQFEEFLEVWLLQLQQ